MGSAKASVRASPSAAMAAAVLILLIYAEAALAAQPALPTAFYGKATYANNTPSEGIIVEATWADTSGITLTSRTKTLTLEEATAAGHPEYAGYYFFNQGFIQAQEGSEIIITATGGVNAQKLNAAPGKEPIPAPPLLLPDVTDKTPPQISSVQTLAIEGGAAAAFSTNELATSAVRYGTTAPLTTAANNTLTTFHLVTLTGLAPYSTYLYEAIATDASGNTATDNNGGSFYRFTTGGQSSETGGAGMAGAQSAKPTPNKGGKQQAATSSQTADGEQPEREEGDFEATPNTLPTSVYGRVTDSEGKPEEDVDVNAEWTDSEGEKHSLTTQTLNSKEAAKLGNPQLAGYYFFKQNLTPPYDSEINITSPQAGEYGAVAKANPGGSSEAVVIRREKRQKRQLKQASPQKIKQAKPEGKKLQVNILKKLPKPGKKFAAFTITLAVLAAAALFTISVRHYASVKKKRKAGNELTRAIKKVTEKSVKGFMAKEIASIEADEELANAARLMLEKEKGGAVVTDNAVPIGWVTENTITKDVILNGIDLSTKTRKTTILKPLLLEAETTLAEAYRQMESSAPKKAIITSGQKIAGIATFTDIAKELESFSNKYAIESQSLPDIASVMRKNIVKVTRNTCLKEAREEMARNNSDYAIVEPDNPEAAEAIITERDILEEMLINPKMAAAFSAAAAAKSPIQSIPIYLDLFEANKVMLAKGLRRMPVTSQGKAVGMVMHEDVIKQLLSYLQQLSRTTKLMPSQIRRK